MISIKITANKDKKTKIKYPYRIYLDNGRIIPVPSQHKFNNAFISHHGCSLVAFYMALRFIGVKKAVEGCKVYLDKKYGLKGHAKYNLKIISSAINKLRSDTVTFKKAPTKEEIQKALSSGKMVIFEERDPIHTVALLMKDKSILRFSDGKYKKVTLDQELRKRCGDSYYGGCVFVKRR